VELFRILHHHPHVEVTALAAGRAAGQPLGAIWPGLQGVSAPPVVALDAAHLAAHCDAVLLALPHGVSGGVVPELLSRGLRVIDLGADFRLRDPATYAAAYGKPHPAPSLLSEAVYGLPEQNRDAIKGARLVANPGCYPTATALAVLPLVRAGLADRVLSSCLSGVSGAGRKPSPKNLYCEVQESAVAYKIAGSHRHTPEMEQTLGVPVVFTPHLVPMRRGMLATVFVAPTRSVSGPEVAALYAEAYANEPLVTVCDRPPSTADVRGTGCAHVHVAVDTARRSITAICVIDNLGKGAASQAVHNLNLSAGLPETAGLPLLPILP
jgi:N-acetyl-gamma-glutamyl-phosphate reductase